MPGNFLDSFLPYPVGFLLGFAFLSFASQDMDMLMVLAVLSMAVAVVRGGLVIRRSSRREDKWEDDWEASHQLERAEDMNIHRVVDIDQRLEALERAETRRLRELVDEGLISAPEAAAETVDDARSTRQRV